MLKIACHWEFWGIRTEWSVVTMRISFEHRKFLYDTQAKFISYRKWSNFRREFPDESVPNRITNCRTWKCFRAAMSAVNSDRTFFSLVTANYEIQLRIILNLYLYPILLTSLRGEKSVVYSVWITEREVNINACTEPIFADSHLQACSQRHNLKILCNCTGRELKCVDPDS